MSDIGAIEAILDEVLAPNQKSVEEFRAGKDKAFNALVGQAMKATKGKGQSGAGERAAEEEARLTEPVSPGSGARRRLWPAAGEPGAVPPHSFAGAELGRRTRR